MTKPFQGLLKLGSSGQAVKEAQLKLGVQTTGTFGTTTEQAVKRFQRDHYLEQNGMIGTTTWGKLFAEDVLLNARDFTQRDSRVFARGRNQAGRSCFSSSCSMLLEWLKPGTLPGPNGDDLYLQKVLDYYGDTTDAVAQSQALASYGIAAHLKTNASFQDVKNQLLKGIVVPLGFLHHGTAQNPTGGGHWLCAIGFDETGLWVHDPWGEIDLQSGEYISTNGAKRHYSYAGFGPRWSPDGKSGWMMVANKP